MIVLTQTSGSEEQKLLMLAVMIGVLAFAICGLWLWRRTYIGRTR